MGIETFNKKCDEIEYALKRLEAMSVLVQELRKDKERLDWILSDAGRFWLSTREDIDKEMTTSFSIFDDLSDEQRQQICHENGQPTQ